MSRLSQSLLAEALPALVPNESAQGATPPPRVAMVRVADGFLPLLLADIACHSQRRVLYIASDGTAMQSLAEAIAFFAPDIAVHCFPAWDCLPYDRVGPSLANSAERLATLAALQQAAPANNGEVNGKVNGEVIVTTAAAIIQRCLTPSRVREITKDLATIDQSTREQFISQLSKAGYVRSDIVSDVGEFAVRGSIVDFYPPERSTADSERGLRVDFFGDDIETVRYFDPTDQRSLGTAPRLSLLPVRETLPDATAVRRFRQAYREIFGATATSDPLYQAVSAGRQQVGMEHWLPLFEAAMGTLFDHLGGEAVLLRGYRVDSTIAAHCEIIRDYYHNRLDQSTQEDSAQPIGSSSGAAGNPSYRPLAPEHFYLGAEEWQSYCTRYGVHLATPFAMLDQASEESTTRAQADLQTNSQTSSSTQIIDCNIRAARNFARETIATAPQPPSETEQGLRKRPRKSPPKLPSVYQRLLDHIQTEQGEGRRCIIASYSSGARDRLAGLLREHSTESRSKPIALALVDSWQAALDSTADGKTTAMLVLPIDSGFVSDDLCLLSEQDILGERLIRRTRKSKDSTAFLDELRSLSLGDLIVHSDHGIGRYEGLTAIAVGENHHDCVTLGYAGGDRLYLPVENLDKLSRYGRDEEGAVALDKLGSEAWQKRKARMKNYIRDIAYELLATSAARSLRSADVIEPSTGYADFCNRFPYQETEDQERAIHEVINGLAAGKPMDCLVCGDVGFGKTEVALRAAFVAAMSGQQVAMICPTTLLARQHFQNFQERFKGFPVNIGRLSRMVPAAEAKATRARLAEGTIDIVIGTHATFAESVAYKKLGLVIIDEEQHFGVLHKERLKKLKKDAHILTLTATPIPRTLQMAMSGLRDIIVIQTPPIDRMVVRSYVSPWDPVVIRQALLREHDRGGQSFFVVPRIKDIPDIEEYLREFVPEVRYVAAHGRMAAGDIEKRMSGFYDREYDLLLSTSIVESGLDIPSANTLVVYRAEMFGLSQLYQLRGRVGRSKIRAFAYLTTANNRVLSETAAKRLQFLSDCDRLGAGFQLASHDLELRGAGNLVGDEQSGHIREVGFELYQSMLEEAILATKAEQAGLAPPQDPLSPTITIDAPILIPEDYIPDLAVRMALYRRLNEATDRAALDALAAEIIDRFGTLPSETENLLVVMEIKIHAIAAGIAKIDVGARGALIAFHKDSFANVPGLLRYMAKLKDRARMRPDHRLAIAGKWNNSKARLIGALQLSKSLATIAQQAS